MRDNAEKEIGIGYFNLARGLGMILIVFGHSMTPRFSVTGTNTLFGGAGSILGGGIIAAFFMISGFGFYKRSPKKCFSIQRKLLLRPYYRVAAAVLATRLILAIVKQRSFWSHGGELVLTYLLGLNGEGGGEICGIPIESVSIFWFVLALFGGWIIYNAIRQLKSEVGQTILVIICVVLSYLLTLISKVWPFCLPMALLAVGYLAVGELLKKKQLLRKKLPLWSWGILLFILLLSAAFGRVNIVACVWKFGFVDVAGSFCAGFLILRFYAWIMKHEWKGKMIRLIEEIGFQSIWVICLHAYEKIIIPWHRVYTLLWNWPWLGVIVCFIGRCIVMYLLYQMIVYFNKKFGRKKTRKKITIE